MRLLLKLFVSIRVRARLCECLRDDHSLETMPDFDSHIYLSMNYILGEANSEIHNEWRRRSRRKKMFFSSLVWNKTPLLLWLIVHTYCQSKVKLFDAYHLNVYAQTHWMHTKSVEREEKMPWAGFWKTRKKHCFVQIHRIMYPWNVQLVILRETRKRRETNVMVSLPQCLFLYSLRSQCRDDGHFERFKDMSRWICCCSTSLSIIRLENSNFENDRRRSVGHFECVSISPLAPFSSSSL